MKLLITESQYNNFVNNNKKTIIITETQYSNLLNSKLLENENTTKNSELNTTISCTADASKCWANDEDPRVTFSERTGWSTANGKQPSRYNKNGFTVVSSEDGQFDFIHIKYFCGYYNPWCSGCRPHDVTNDPLGGFSMDGGPAAKGKYPSPEVKKFVKTVMDLGIAKVGKRAGAGKRMEDTPWIVWAGLTEYKKRLENRLQNAYYVKSTEYGPKKYKYPDYAIKDQLAGIQSLIIATDSGHPRTGFVRNWCPMTTSKIAPPFKGWTATDFLDAASIVLLAGSYFFPPLALGALALEGIALSISVVDFAKGEGSLLDVGIRVLCLFGGPLIGRGIGKLLKGGKNAMINGYNLVRKFFGMNPTSKQVTREAIEAFVKQQNLSAADRQAFEEWMNVLKNGGEEFADELIEMEAVLARANAGDKAALEIVEGWIKKGQKQLKVADDIIKSNPANRLFGRQYRGFSSRSGKGFKNKLLLYWDEVTEPMNLFGSGLLLGIYGYSEYMKFQNTAKQLGYEEEQIKLVDKLAMKELTEKKDIKRMLNKYKSKDDVMGELFYNETWTPEITNKIIKRASEIMSENDFKRFSKMVNDSMGSTIEKFLRKRYYVYKKLWDIKSKLSNTLVNDYMGNCTIPIEWQGKNMLDTITIKSKMDQVDVDQFIKKIDYAKTNNHVEKIGDYHWVFKGPESGVYKITRPGGGKPNKLERFETNCSWMRKEVNKICKDPGNNKDRLEFCSKVDLVSIDLDELKMIPLEYSEKDIKNNIETILKQESKNNDTEWNLKDMIKKLSYEKQ